MVWWVGGCGWWWGGIGYKFFANNIWELSFLVTEDLIAEMSDSGRGNWAFRGEGFHRSLNGMWHM